VGWVRVRARVLSVCVWVRLCVRVWMLRQSGMRVQRSVLSVGSVVFVVVFGCGLSTVGDLWVGFVLGCLGVGE
jgi:hypothetical protein